ncbi:CwfJ C-terminus 1-domain-containing protein-like protein [Peziza echinospora]|nr:CwfJ C-terminus 1-domain-containing protein-like protein [Peziza echinospora]
MDDSAARETHRAPEEDTHEDSGRRERHRHRDGDRRDRERERDRDRGGAKDKHRERAGEKDGKEDRHRSHRSSRRVDEKGDREGKGSERDRDRDRRDRDDKDRHHRHHHHSHRRKRSRGPDDEAEAVKGDDADSSSTSRRHKSRRSKSPSGSKKDTIDEDVGQWTEKPALAAESPVPEAATAKTSTLKRDSWMVQSEQDAFDFTQRGAAKKEKPIISKPDYAPIVHRMELNTNLKEGRSLDDYVTDADPGYTFGDSGSNWRMMKLKRVYEVAKESGKSVDEVALERFGDLKSFDDAREEQQELDRRQMYGKDRQDTKEKPTGDFYAERLRKHAIKVKDMREREPPQGQTVQDGPHTTTTAMLDKTALNRMQAALLKAQLRGDPKAVEMETEYNAALARFANQKEPEIVVLSAMDSRMLAHGIGGRGEVKEITTGKRKGKLEDNDEMTLEDMIREEKRTKGQGRGGEGRMFADQIAKDGKFTDNLDYMDENADRLAKRVHKNDINLKNVAISDFKKMQHVLDTCPLCSHEEKNAPPIAPVVSLGTRVFLTLPTQPELSPGSAMIVPIQHRTNTLECDDDEWEEIRNFMKSLIRFYHSQSRGVIFYENAAHPSRKQHAGITAIPMPEDLANTAAAYFREGILSYAPEWAQHRKILSTLSPTLGKRAFRSTLIKEMPYFHVWLEIDGGLGHIIEDGNTWPRGDMFARQIIGGMLDCDEVEVIRRQGRWNRGGDPRRVENFRKDWKAWDWTNVLLDGGN